MTTREHYSKQFDDIIEAIKNDKDKILDIITDYCSNCEISFNFSLSDVPSYSVNYTKIAHEQIMKRYKEN